jgi:hypothetical protein
VLCSAAFVSPVSLFFGALAPSVAVHTENQAKQKRQSQRHCRTPDQTAFAAPALWSWDATTMQETNEEQLRRLDEQERRLVKDLPPPHPREPAAIDWTDLAEAPPDSPIATEWNYYRRQVGRLLAEGHEGRWALIQGEQIVGIWDTLEEANEVQATLTQGVMVKQIMTRETLLRIGYLNQPLLEPALPRSLRAS